jgi:hypothetical protein
VILLLRVYRMAMDPRLVADPIAAVAPGQRMAAAQFATQNGDPRHR